MLMTTMMMTTTTMTIGTVNELASAHVLRHEHRRVIRLVDPHVTRHDDRRDVARRSMTMTTEAPRDGDEILVTTLLVATTAVAVTP